MTREMQTVLLLVASALSPAAPDEEGPRLSPTSVWEERRAQITRLMPGWWEAPEDSPLRGAWEWERDKGGSVFMSLEKGSVCLRIEPRKHLVNECVWRVQSREDLIAGRIVLLWYRMGETKAAGKHTYTVMFDARGDGEEDDVLMLGRIIKDDPIEAMLWKRMKELRDSSNPLFFKTEPTTQ